MYITLSGRVENIDIQQGKSRAGKDWMKAIVRLVMDETSQYPKHCVFTIFGAEKIKAINAEIGEEINVDCDIDASEWNGKWYNDIVAFRRHGA